MTHRYNSRSLNKWPFIQELPKELRAKIFAYIEPKKALKLRLVCRLWNKEVTDLYNYTIRNLDETSKHFEAKLRQRIQELGVEQLEATSVLKADGTAIFSHPNLITRLYIKTEKYIGGPFVSAPNVYALLGLLSENLRVLSICIGPLFYNHPAPSDLSYNFPKLTHLELYTDERDDLVQPPGRNFLAVLGDSKFPTLRDLDAGFKFSQGIPKDLLVETLVKMVANNGALLESLKLSIPHDSGPEVLTISQANLDRFQTLTLEKLKVIYVDYYEHYVVVDGFWARFFTNQKNLGTVTLYQTAFDFPANFVPNNEATLVELHLGLHVPQGLAPFDLAIFGRCENLKILQLMGLHADWHQDLDGGEADVVNFHRLPPNVTEVWFHWLRIRSMEIALAFTTPENTNDDINGTKGFKRLDFLVLSAVGMKGAIGLTPEILETVLASGSLLELEVVAYDLSLAGARDFGAVFTNLGYNGNRICPCNLHFHVKRNSSKGRWRRSVETNLRFE